MSKDIYLVGAKNISKAAHKNVLINQAEHLKWASLG
jgi:hypothetical protein